MFSSLVAMSRWAFCEVLRSADRGCVDACRPGVAFGVCLVSAVARVARLGCRACTAFTLGLALDLPAFVAFECVCDFFGMMFLGYRVDVSARRTSVRQKPSSVNSL